MLLRREKSILTHSKETSDDFSDDFSSLGMSKAYFLHKM